ncbi:hypothetical protein OF83DRAFT_1130440 [Amylostereum chailletii]|nr:hypothetical protein OF83DRAFT_1130440 [Amylostereum chailletii]
MASQGHYAPAPAHAPAEASVPTDPVDLSAAASSSSLPGAPLSHTSTVDSAENSEDDSNGGKKKSGKSRRRKVNHACLYCRRSHMTCDEGRPCQRCIKREIGHLCHDEPRPSKGDKHTHTPGPASAQMNLHPTTLPYTTQPIMANPSSWPSSAPEGALMYPPETLGKEFSSLTDFLETLDEHAFFNPTGIISQPLGSSAYDPGLVPPRATSQPQPPPSSQQAQPQPQSKPPEPDRAQSPTTTRDPQPPDQPTPGVLPTASMTEKFLLTAADQEPGSRDERLKRVIRTKYEAGLLKPYNYVKGYARLSRWMDKNVSQESKQQILHPLSVLRPKFRAIAQSLRDIDLVFIEEAFERLLLDYDRVFSVMGIPACLWRRTGEIYKGNREFAELVGVDGYMLRDGRLCIYELMAEESAVNYWEKYGNVAFDSSQKAVLTSCVLRYKPAVTPAGATTPGRREDAPNEEGYINCCFSFTIRRDTWGIPSMIVGNFIRL